MRDHYHQNPQLRLDCTFNLPFLVIDVNPIRAYKRYKINTETFRAMGVESPPKYVNRELNSQIGIRSQDSYFSESDGPPYIHAPMGCYILCQVYRRDVNDSSCTTSFVVIAGCVTAALAVTAQIRTGTTQHVTHIKIYILAQFYHQLQHRLIHVHIPHI